MDGDGRLARIAGTVGAAQRDGVRTEIALAVPGTGGAPARPVHVLAIDLGLSLAGIPNALASGTITVRAVGTSTDRGRGRLDRHAGRRPGGRHVVAAAVDNGPFEPVRSAAARHREPSRGERRGGSRWPRSRRPEIAAVANPVFLDRRARRGRHDQGDACSGCR